MVGREPRRRLAVQRKRSSVHKAEVLSAEPRALAMARPVASCETVLVQAESDRNLAVACEPDSHLTRLIPITFHAESPVTPMRLVIGNLCGGPVHGAWRAMHQPRHGLRPYVSTAGNAYILLAPMTGHRVSYSFAPFLLVPSECQLFRHGDVVDLAPKTLDLLVLLVERSGLLVLKEDITRALWPEVSVTDNALTQLVHELRAALEDESAAPMFIQTVPRRGYRFIAIVERQSAVPSSADDERPAKDTLPTLGRTGVRETSNLAAHLAFTDGRLKLERMNLAEVDSAIGDFERALALDPRYAMAYVGLAHARFLRFEASRPYAARATNDLMTALSEVQHAIDLDPDLPEAHAALALMLSSAGRGTEAVEAGRRAVALEPSNWRNHCRLGFAAWGSERVSAWTRVIELFPDFAYAYYGLSMVVIARNDLTTAERWLRRGARLQDASHLAHSRFPGKGLHWLLGFIRLALGQRAQARADFDR